MISFIIPAHNEEALIGATLDSIFACAKAAGRPFEVIVSCDACTDRTAEITRQKGARAVECNNRQIAATRNSGAREAKGEIFIFIDADTLLTDAALRDALKRFQSGVYALWYPQVQRRESRQFPEQLKELQEKDWLHVTLTVKKPVAGGLGLHGSGMFVLNPPWLLPRALELALPYLARMLAQDAAAAFELECELA